MRTITQALPAISTALTESIAPRPAFLDRPVDLAPSKWLDRFRRHLLRKKLDRAVASEAAVRLGSDAIPFESLDERDALLDALARRRGVIVTVPTRGDLHADELSRLARLDLDHAVTVEVRLEAPTSARRFGALRAVARAAERGLVARLVVESFGTDRRSLETLVAEAADAGVLDVVAAIDEEATRSRQAIDLYRLRLRHGLPRVVAGRG